MPQFGFGAPQVVHVTLDPEIDIARSKGIQRPTEKAVAIFVSLWMILDVEAARFSRK